MLKKALRILCHSVLEDFGHPMKLISLVENDPTLNRHLVEHEKGIGTEGIVRWNDFGNLPYETSRPHMRQLNGWRHTPGAYRNYGDCSVQREDLLNLGTVQEFERKGFDIQQIDGFSASKSDLNMFKTTDAMARRNAKQMITPATHEKLQENLAWDEIRIISRDDHDSFATWEWDGRVFLVNSGGSHHFAAAKLLARELGVEIPLSGRYRVYGINQIALATLRRDFEMFVMSWHCTQQLAFHRALESFGATYYWKDLPRPYTDQAAIFLPKDEKRSVKVAEVLKKVGFQDLGLYLKKLSRR